MMSGYLSIEQVETAIAEEMSSLNYGADEYDKVSQAIRDGVQPHDYAHALDYALRCARGWVKDKRKFGSIEDLCEEVLQVYGRPHRHS